MDIREIKILWNVKNVREDNMKTIKVNGMHCANCKAAVEKAVSALPGVKNAQVDLASGELRYEDADGQAPASSKLIKETIIGIGFEPAD